MKICQDFLFSSRLHVEIPILPRWVKCARGCSRRKEFFRAVTRTKQPRIESKNIFFFAQLASDENSRTHFFLFLLDAASFSRSSSSRAVLCGVCGETRQISDIRLQPATVHACTLYAKKESWISVYLWQVLYRQVAGVETQRHKKRKSSRREIWDGWENFQVFLFLSFQLFQS